MSEGIQKWYWWTPFTDVDFWKEAVDVRPEAKEFILEATDVIGRGAGNILSPTAKAVSKPVLAVAAVLAGAGFIGWIFRDEIKHIIGKSQ